MRPGTPAVPGTDDKEYALAADALAEQAYLRDFGCKRDRTGPVHLVKRGEDYRGQSFLLTPPIWPFVQKFGHNFALFYTVGKDLASTTLDGWQYFERLQNVAEPFAHGGHVVADEDLRKDFGSIPIFCPKVLTPITQRGSLVMTATQPKGKTVKKTVVQPTYDRLLIKRDAPVQQVGQIQLAEQSIEKPSEGTIMAIGPSILQQNKQAELMDQSADAGGIPDMKGTHGIQTFHLGDKVTFGKYSGIEVTVNGDEVYVLLKADEITSKLVEVEVLEAVEYVDAVETVLSDEALPSRTVLSDGSEIVVL